jgi:hypothetical protein
MWSDFSLTSPMTVTTIQPNPKDDRYLAIGFAGHDNTPKGSIIIYSFGKMKVFWTHGRHFIRCSIVFENIY